MKDPAINSSWIMEKKAPDVFYCILLSRMQQHSNKDEHSTLPYMSMLHAIHAIIEAATATNRTLLVFEEASHHTVMDTTPPC